MRRLREDYVTEDNLRFDEGCQIQYLKKKHTGIMLNDCKKCSYIGSNINDAHRHVSKEHKYAFNIDRLREIIGENQTPNIEIEAICIPAII